MFSKLMCITSEHNATKTKPKKKKNMYPKMKSKHIYYHIKLVATFVS